MSSSVTFCPRRKNVPFALTTVLPHQFPVCCFIPVRALNTVLFPTFGFPTSKMVRSCVECSGGREGIFSTVICRRSRSRSAIVTPRTENAAIPPFLPRRTHSASVSGISPNCASLADCLGDAEISITRPRSPTDRSARHKCCSIFSPFQMLQTDFLLLWSAYAGAEKMVHSTKIRHACGTVRASCRQPSGTAAENSYSPHSRRLLPHSQYSLRRSQAEKPLWKYGHLSHPDGS